MCYLIDFQWAAYLTEQKNWNTLDIFVAAVSGLTSTQSVLCTLHGLPQLHKHQFWNYFNFPHFTKHMCLWIGKCIFLRESLSFHEVHLDKLSQLSTQQNWDWCRDGDRDGNQSQSFRFRAGSSVTKWSPVMGLQAAKLLTHVHLMSVWQTTWVEAKRLWTGHRTKALCRRTGVPHRPTPDKAWKVRPKGQWSRQGAQSDGWTPDFLTVYPKGHHYHGSVGLMGAHFSHTQCRERQVAGASAPPEAGLRVLVFPRMLWHLKSGSGLECSVHS